MRTCVHCAKKIPEAEDIALMLVMAIRQEISAGTALSQDLLVSVADVAVKQLGGCCATCKFPLRAVGT